MARKSEHAAKTTPVVITSRKPVRVLPRKTGKPAETAPQFMFTDWASI